MPSETPVYQLALSPVVGTLFAQLLQLPESLQLFCSRVDLCEGPLEKLLEQHAIVSGIAPDEDYLPPYHLNYRERLEIITHPDLELFRPVDEFHVAFSAFPFEYDLDAAEREEMLKAIRPVLIKDRLEFFKCSQGKENRAVPYHILGLEQMLRAVFCGGYFGAVLPKRWIGREMKYLGWWNDHAARMVRIKLPRSAVSLKSKPDTTGKYQHEQAAPGDWELLIWNRPYVPDDEVPSPNSGRYPTQLLYAKQRHAEFVHTLENLSARSLADCVAAFQQNNWYEFSVQHWQEFLKDNHADTYLGSWNTTPKGLKNPKDIYFFNPRPEFATGLTILPDKAAIEKMPHAVHIKVNRRVKLRTYKAHAAAGLLDFKHNSDFLTKEDGTIVFKADSELKFKPFSEVKEKLIGDLENLGLHPCMTQKEYHDLQRQERWLSIQLTPIERMIPIGKEAQAHHEGLQTGEEKFWERAYADIGVQTSFPELFMMWKSRALQMNMHKFLYDFQVDDIVYYAIKQCLVNGSVPGLGKTRTSLLGELLRGAKKILIVCPSKLIGVWQDEIDNTIVPYCRQQRRNWMGQILDPSYQVIEWAKDCLPANLRTFNLISYDKLKTTPRDGLFYRCPRCGTIVYSAKVVGRAHATELAQVCPGDPALPAEHPSRCNNLVRRWKTLCKEQGKRKWRVLLDEQGVPLKRLMPEYDLEGNVVQETEVWHHVRFKDIGEGPDQFPVERILEIDERPPRPVLPKMEPQENIYKKVKKIIVGYEEDRNNSGVRMPIYRNIERKSHVKWTFSDLLRWQFSHVIADEALNFVNDDALRTRAMYHLTGSCRRALTGTPIKNKPENILGIFNWTFGSSVFPNYRSYDDQGLKRFLDKYRTVVFIAASEVDSGGGTQTVGGKEKPIPKVNNPELFQAEMAPLMLRHVRNEPDVRADIPPKELVHHEIKIEMDPEHKAYYRLWIAEFAEWWGKMKEEEEGKANIKGALLTKLTYLCNCSIEPYAMLDNILKGKDVEGKNWARKIGTYQDFCLKHFGIKPRVTAKMRAAFELLKQAVAAEDKTIIFSIRRHCLDVGQAWCQKKGLESMIIHGGISNAIPPGRSRSKRHEMVEAFRHHAFHALWAGLGCLDVGVNIPEANHGIILDCSWEDATPTQAIGRMIRPAQTKTIHRYNMMHLGAIDDYMFALSYLKGRSGQEAIDYMEFDDFSTTIIPDIHQFANAIVDGTEEEVKRRMWLAVDHLRRQDKEEGSDQESD